MVHNDNKFCLLHSISQKPCILSFMVHICKNDNTPRHFCLFFKILVFWIVGGGEEVKGQKNGPNDKNSVSLTPYLRNRSSYDCDFFGRGAGARGIKREKMTENYQFQSVLLYISGTVDHIIEILIMISPGVFLCIF